MTTVRCFSYSFILSEWNECKISIFGLIETYEVIGINKYSNERKRMSIVFKKDGIGLIFVKGAEHSIIT